MKYSEAHVLDISSLKETGGRERAIQVIKEASPTGLLHVINHELASEDVRPDKPDGGDLRSRL